MSELSSIQSYLGRARWFGGKGRDFEVTAAHDLGVVHGPVPCTVVLAEVTYADGEVDHYQLPLVFHTEPETRLDHAFVGWWDDPDRPGAMVHAYDAIHDHEAMAGWLAGFVDGKAEGLAFHTMPGAEIDLSARGTPFTGEQSNSSIAFAEDSVLKVFRRVTPGANPDITTHEVLTRAGSDHVAALYGWVEATDPDSGEVLHLAMLQQFLRTASDGFDLALASVRNLFAEADLHADEVGGDFASEASRLGIALAETHATLAREFPSASRTPEEQAELAGEMRRRLDEAVQVVPELADFHDPLCGLFDAAAEVDERAVQQIHGDLHLGQTLRTVKGWKIVDFEGEPAKSLAERTKPDSRWRDVAGMLRSFEYAPRVVDHTLRETEPTGAEQRAFRAGEWSDRNCEAFLAAYAGDAGLTPAQKTLLAAYVADKAVYETVYEARNRPSWVDIPLSAIEKLVAS